MLDLRIRGLLNCKRVLPVGALLMALSACHPSSPERASLSEGDLIAIRMLASSHLDAVMNQDADSVAALYTEDAVQMPHGRPIVQGRQAIRAALVASAGPFTDLVSFWGVSPGRESVEGDVAYRWGTYWLMVGDTIGTEPTPHAGKYLVLLRKQAPGSWRIAREIWTVDQPGRR